MTSHKIIYRGYPMETFQTTGLTLVYGMYIQDVIYQALSLDGAKAWLDKFLLH